MKMRKTTHGIELLSFSSNGNLPVCRYYKLYFELIAEDAAY